MRILWFVLAAILLVAGIVGLRFSAAPAPPVVAAAPTRVERLLPNSVATLDSSPFHYSPGWKVTAQGADPSQPADASTQPSGVVTFTYSGGDLLLQVAQGNYWGYLYVTVD